MSHINCQEDNDPLAKYSPEERQVRIELAAAYRMFEHLGWSDIIYNHLTVAIPGKPGQFLINPFGLLFDEITASSLIAIDLEGNVIDQGTTSYTVNKAGYVIHSAVHEARPDIAAVMHCHSINGTAVSCSKHGLLPISQNAHLIHHEVTYHDYEGIAMNPQEKQRIVSDLGPTKKIMILRNHGLLTTGSTIAEAFWLMFALNKACDIQVAALSHDGEDLNWPTEESILATKEIVSKPHYEGVKRGQLEFEAMFRRMKKLDPSFMK